MNTTHDTRNLTQKEENVLREHLESAMQHPKARPPLLGDMEYEAGFVDDKDDDDATFLVGGVVFGITFLAVAAVVLGLMMAL